jgi:D-arabinitol 4-dehydrogenase
LPFAYEDQALDRDAVRALLASDDPVAAFCADGRLWGPLAGDPRLTKAVRDAFGRAGALLER